MKPELLRGIPSARSAVLAAGSSTLSATAVSRTAFGPDQLADAVMIDPLSSVLVSPRFGYGPSLLAAVLSVLCFDFFFRARRTRMRA